MCGADEHRHRHEQAHEAREHVRVEHVGVHDIRLEKLDDPCQAKDAAWIRQAAPQVEAHDVDAARDGNATERADGRHGDDLDPPAPLLQRAGEIQGLFFAAADARGGYDEENRGLVCDHTRFAAACSPCSLCCCARSARTNQSHGSQ